MHACSWLGDRRGVDRDRSKFCRTRATFVPNRPCVHVSADGNAWHDPYICFIISFLRISFRRSIRSSYNFGKAKGSFMYSSFTINFSRIFTGELDVPIFTYALGTHQGTEGGVPLHCCDVTMLTMDIFIISPPSSTCDLVRWGLLL